MVQRRPSHAQENPVTAIDIALEPDAKMIRQADNARLLKAYPEGFALDATHHAHITMLQQFVRTADLEKVYSAANAVLAKEGVASRRLKAIKYYYIPSPPLGIAGIVVESTEDLLRLQYELLDAVAPFTEKTGTPAAFVSTDRGRDIKQGLIDYVANFTTVAAGKKFNPHVTIGVAPETYLNEMLAEPFEAFMFPCGRGCLPTRQLWRRPQGAPSIVADALSALPAHAVPKRAPINGERQLFGFLDDRGQRCRCADSPAGHAGHPDDLWLPVPMIVMDIVSPRAFFEPIETKTAEWCVRLSLPGRDDGRGKDGAAQHGRVVPSEVRTSRTI